MADSELKCGGILGSLLELSKLAGVDEQKIQNYDDEWFKMLLDVNCKVSKSQEF